MSGAEHAAAEELWRETARSVSTIAAARMLGFVPRGRARIEASGPCPKCGTAGSKDPKRSDRFNVGVTGPKKNLFFCRACGIRGGDAVELVRQVRGLGFRAACEVLVGPPPAGAALSAKDLDRMQAAAAALKARRAEDERVAAEAQAKAAAERRAQAMALWPKGQQWKGTLAEQYLRLRGIVPGNLRNLRFHAALNLNCAGRTVHRGPAMLALIEDVRGVATGVHRTWIDVDTPPKYRPAPRDPDTCAIVIDPETGRPCATKKMLGEAKGGVWRGIDGPEAKRLFLAEGIETLLSVHTALARASSALLGRAAFHAALSIDNLVFHLDAMAEAATRPATCAELWLLEDGDTAEATLARVRAAATRAARSAGFAHIYVVTSRAGMDFSDMLTEVA